LERRAVEVIAACRQRGWTVAVAESCTGGEVMAALSSIPGASAQLWGGAVVYSAEAKCALAGLAAEQIAGDGVVSAATTRRLAEGIRQRSGADLGLAVTGWAGPDSDGPDPVGSVYLGVATDQGTHVELRRYDGSRAGVRRAASAGLLAMALEVIDASGSEGR
jgi:nicotinamide-nucleotide amidase